MLVDRWLGVEANALSEWLGTGSEEGWSQYWRRLGVEGTLASLLLLATLELTRVTCISSLDPHKDPGKQN